MNLVAKEYVACRAEEDGMLILSEFAGAAQELREAMLVNPYDPEAIRRQIELALSMPSEERRRRMSALAERVGRRDIRWWTTTFLELLAAAGTAPRLEAVRSPLH
jgi:trehalose 6-phosphate synthase/phosphatase